MTGPLALPEKVRVAERRHEADPGPRGRFGRAGPVAPPPDPAPAAVVHAPLLASVGFGLALELWTGAPDLTIFPGKMKIWQFPE